MTLSATSARDMRQRDVAGLPSFDRPNGGAIGFNEVRPNEVSAFANSYCLLFKAMALIYQKRTVACAQR